MENSLIDGRYALLAPLGSGGEARVFRALDRVTSGEVAVRLSKTGRDRLASIAAPAFFHDGWIHFHAAGFDPQHGVYQVFELLEGQTLRQVAEAAPLDSAGWRQFVAESLAAVEAVHLAGCAHGDLNADNFFRTIAKWKLLELPFARFEAPAGRTALFGSIHTLAPEQFDGVAPNFRTDLYALGCLYYYAAAGAYPHPGASIQEVAISCLRFPPRPLRETAPGLPEAWSDWVMRLIAPKPEDRFSSIAAACHLLD